ncbi:GroES-like protein [Gymnopus androsaceus JB14]|uniref:GroES-like protein n=1 Tax=Gymnopus androsaceus JB14 TaxID=1447944 RepID=A0A6A4I9S1_9AGAR|nr:GroES-like protein [Gymnopus androsaceus JB14]
MITTKIPDNIRAIQIQAGKTVKVVSIPFGQHDLVKNLPRDQIIIYVRAVALNPVDWKQAFGEWGVPGSILGVDCAGYVIQVGSAVKHLKVGDRAAGLNFGGSSQTHNGAFAEYVRLEAPVTFKLPDEMTYEEGASLPGAHLSSVQALYMRLGIPKPFIQPSPSEKEIILIWGGSTAVGHNAIQLARISGLRIFAVAASAVHDDLKALGVEKCFDYKAETDVVKQIQDAAGEPGIIYGFDTVADNGTTEQCIDAMSFSRRSHLIVVLPPSEACQQRRIDKVKVEFFLGQTLLGAEFTFASTQVPAIPEDRTRALEYVVDYMPHILQGWKAGQGGTKFKPQHLRRMDGGLDKIEQGLKIMRDGKYGREKLVYTLN